MTGLKSALTAVLAAAVLACAACSGSPAPAPTPSPAVRVSANQATLLIMQCFLDQHLIPSSALHPSPATAPGTDSALWVKNGKVVSNVHLGDWYRDVGAGMTVKGKVIDDWVHSLEASSKNWPSRICGPMPALR